MTRLVFSEDPHDSLTITITATSHDWRLIEQAFVEVSQDLARKAYQKFHFSDTRESLLANRYSSIAKVICEQLDEKESRAPTSEELI
jgi:hypothetical protein